MSTSDDLHTDMLPVTQTSIYRVDIGTTSAPQRQSNIVSIETRVWNLMIAIPLLVVFFFIKFTTYIQKMNK